MLFRCRIALASAVRRSGISASYAAPASSVNSAAPFEAVSFSPKATSSLGVPSASPTEVRVSKFVPAAHNSGLSVIFDDGLSADFSALWLRDNCLQFSKASHRDYAIPGVHDAFEDASLRGDGSLVVEWKDGHFSVFPNSYLRKWSQKNVVRGEALTANIASVSNPAREYQYSSLAEPSNLLHAMRSLNELGVVIIKNCTTELAPMGPANLMASATPHSLLDIMAKFAEVPAYIPLYGYGSDYLLGAEKNETQRNCPQCFCNIPKPIEMHQDFAYFDDVPGLFYSFCMRIDKGIVGGTNTCMDAYHVAERLRNDDPEAFEALSNICVTFAKDAMNSQRPVKSSVDRPIIRVDADGNIVDVMWSLMYLRTQRLDGPTLERFARAREAWKAAIRRAVEDGYEVQTPMGPGDCTILNNKRMMHARLPFSNVDGVRQFYQTYGQEGLFRNRLKVLEEQCAIEDAFYVHQGGSCMAVTAQ